MEQYLMIGTVLKPQGVRGEVKIRPYFADEDAFLGWDTLYLRRGDDYEPISCSGNRLREGFAYAILGGAASMEEAEKLRDAELYIDRAHAAELPAGEVYIHDLIGCVAVTADGREIGTLKDVLQYGPIDTWVFTTHKGEMMAPALKHVFLSVDLSARTILTDAKTLGEVAVYAD